jgi:hypothetical protein|tara:strand:+ start:638 stop:802 length:165 start_codon:yes stop_codon:yes gene_type:complete
MTKEQEKMIEDFRQRMHSMRFANEDWQLTHQKRWDEDSLCWDDKCDCEKKNERT